MQLSKRKTAVTIAMFLVSIFAISLVAMPSASAHTPTWTVVSYAYIVPAPNPVGVGQTVAIVMWVDVPMPGAAIGNDIRRHDYKLTITAPNGDIQTENWPVVSDPTSVVYWQFTPDQVGTYTLKFDYPEQTYTWGGAYENDVFTAASRTTTLTVQEEPIAPATGSYPLPTEYWTEPIEGQNTNWYAISSNWLGEPYITSGAAVGGGTAGNFFARIQPNGLAPNSPHIMWTKPIQDGGVVPGNSTGIPGEMYYTGSSYNTRFVNSLVMDGRLYYQEPYGNSGGGGDYVCVDLRTGAELWRTNTTGIGVPSFGYLYAFDDPNQHGILPNGLLIAASGYGTQTWRTYDPRTGIPTTMTVNNVPSTDTTLAQVAGPSGEILKYAVTNIGNATNPDWRLTQWNSSRVIGSESGIGVGGWYSGTMDASLPSCYDWNISITLPNADSWRVDRASLDNIMLLVQGSFGGHPGAAFGTVSIDGANVTAISLKPATRGQVLWTKHFAPAPGNVTRALSNWDPNLGVFILADKETGVMYGYSLTDGSPLWGPTEPMNDYTYFRTFPAVSYGKIYFAGYGGVLYCYDITNGDLLWTYGNGGPGNSTYAGFDTPYGTYPIFIDVIADGKVYLGTTEHSPDSPLYKDAQYRCINATDGTELWTMMGWGTGMDSTYDLIADGYFVYLNIYDMQIYSIGKGPSATTASIQNDVITQGNSVLIKGTVLDVSAGTKQAEQAARFPYGVTAVSDASMSAWMEYVYMQKPRPTDTVGVNVTLSVLDANNNFREIGTTTSDANGFYSFQWTPDIPGKYTVYASFAGSESYWPSQAETALAVNAAPEATPEPTPMPSSMADQFFLPISIGLIIAIAVVIALLALLLIRRRL
jgi:outer membrane protein assembly factor BamB